MASVEKRTDKNGNVRYRVRWREYAGGPQLARHFKLSKDAKAFASTIQADIGRGTYLSPDQQRVTFAQYVETHLARQTWRPATMHVARRAFGHWTDVLGADRPLASIRRGDVERGIVAMTAKMAPSTVKVQFQHLRTLMRAALHDQVLAVDPTATAGKRLPKSSSELQIPTPELVRQFLELAPAHFRAAIILGAHVGLRAGEAQGLLVADVDFMRRTVNVRRQLSNRPTLALREPKTSASLRSVPVPSSVVDELGRHVKTYGPGRDGVLLHVAGDFMDQNAFNGAWRQTQRAAGLTPGTWRFHSLRHAFASSLISAGCSVKAVAVAMGHETPTTTLNTYASLWPGDDDRIRAAIESAWRAEDSLRTHEA